MSERRPFLFRNSTYRISAIASAVQGDGFIGQLATILPDGSLSVEISDPDADVWVVLGIYLTSRLMAGHLYRVIATDGDRFYVYRDPTTLNRPIHMPIVKPGICDKDLINRHIKSIISRITG